MTRHNNNNNNNIFTFSGGNSFSGCNSLSQIVLTSGLVQIGPGIQIFYATAVTSLIIPSSVTFMGEFRVMIIIINIIKSIVFY